MKKLLNQIINETVKGVHDEMYDCIQNDMRWMSYDKYYGLTIVRVEVEEHRTLSGRYDDVQVMVLHDDCTHQSPLLEKEIEKALPNWFNVEREVELAY